MKGNTSLRIVRYHLLGTKYSNKLLIKLGDSRARASTRDLEGKYRYVWALYTILEDYFAFKGLRYQGPKKAFHYLEIHDPEILPFFDEALSNLGNVDSLEKLIKKITT